MASAQNNNSDRLVIFRGDDTGGTFGRTLAFTIDAAPGVSLDGCKAEWIFDGIVKTLGAPLVSGEVREIFYSHNETRCMALGVRYGTFRIIDAAGKVRTFTNTKAVEVTDNVARCYPGSSTATVCIGTMISWEQIAGRPLLVKTINGEPPDADGNMQIVVGGDVKHSDFADIDEKEGMTLKEVGAMYNTLVRKLKGTVAAFAALLAFGAFAENVPLSPDMDFGDIHPTQKLANVVHVSVDGAARPLPKYLHLYEANDSYPAEAAEYYRSRGDGKVDGGCSAVRSGGFVCRNFDYPLDERAEFVVKMSAGPNRFASVGVSQVGTNLTEQIVTSGKPNRWDKSLPGATVDGINENGVVCEINVVDGEPQWRSGILSASDIHPLAAVRWVLDRGTSAGMAASNLASRIKFPSGWEQNFHWMIADETQTWIVENGTASNVTAVAAKRVMTNFPILSDTYSGMGKERYQILLGGANITNAWYTNAYRRETNPPWVSDLAEVIAYTNDIFDAWATHDKEYFRGQLIGGRPWWQTVHTSVYDITNRTLRVAVQEVDDWYTFQVPSAGGVKPEAVKEIVRPMIGEATNGLATARLPSWLTAESEEPRGKTDLDVYGETFYWIVKGDYPGFVKPYRIIEQQYSEDEWDYYLEDAEYRLTDMRSFETRQTHLDFGYGCTADLVRMKTGAKLAHTSATSGIAKLGAGGELIAATPSSTGGASADYRDPKDNVCHEDVFGEWSEVPRSGLHSIVRLTMLPEYNPSDGSWYAELYLNSGDYEQVATLGSPDDDSVTFYAAGDSITATRQRVATKDEPFVTQTFVTNEVATAISTNNPAFVSAVRDTPAPEPGQGEDPPWGTWGTVGAAIAGLVAALKMTVKKIKCGTMPEITPTNGVADVSDFFSKSNTLLNARITYERNATGLKDRAFNAITFDGTEYNLSTALAAVTPTASGQPRDLLIVATATAATTISFTDGTIKGDKPTIDGEGTWLITLTEYASGVWYCRQIKMEDAA